MNRTVKTDVIVGKEENKIDDIEVYLIIITGILIFFVIVKLLKMLRKVYKVHNAVLIENYEKSSPTV